jgi:hypothetical protein
MFEPWPSKFHYVKCFEDTTPENASSTRLQALVPYMEDAPSPTRDSFKDGFLGLAAAFEPHGIARL